MCQNVYTSLHPLHLVLKFLGFALFTVDSKSFKITYTIIDGLFLLLHVFLGVILSFFFWTTPFLFYTHMSEVVVSFFPGLVYLILIVFTGVRVWLFYHRYRFVELFKLVKAVDDTLESLGFQFDYKKQWRVIVSKIAFNNILEFGTVAACYVYQRIYNAYISYKIFLVSFYSFFSNLVFATQFMLLVCVVSERYKAMNEVLG